eukprot:gene32226-41769_t
MRAELAVRARPSALAHGPRAEAFSRSQVGPGPSWGRPKPSQSYIMDPLTRVMLMTGYKPWEEVVANSSSFGPILNNAIKQLW